MVNRGCWSSFSQNASCYVMTLFSHGSTFCCSEATSVSAWSIIFQTGIDQNSRQNFVVWISENFFLLCCSIPSVWQTVLNQSLKSFSKSAFKALLKFNLVNVTSKLHIFTPYLQKACLNNLPVRCLKGFNCLLWFSIVFRIF